MKRLRDLVRKEEAEKQKRDPEIPDGPPEPLGGNDRDDPNHGRRPAIERTGPFGREHKIPGTGGREIEGAFHGDRTVVLRCSMYGVLGTEIAGTGTGAGQEERTTVAGVIGKGAHLGDRLNINILTDVLGHMSSGNVFIICK